MATRTYRETITIAEGVELVIPDPVDVEAKYRLSAENGSFVAFPYWTRLWPSAFAMARFIKSDPGLFHGKRVLELGAGLGLPSFVVAPVCASVNITDHAPESLEWIRLNVERLQLANAEAALVDWGQGQLPKADVVLMSDVSYDPESFDVLIQVMEHYLDEGCRMIIAIPERIISGSFYSLISKDIVESITYAIEEKRVVVASLAR